MKTKYVKEKVIKETLNVNIHTPIVRIFQALKGVKE
tara:strand:+ start:71 stop:178 length:108 start_codon:yes stop_codon:yes gene_type:complete